ncbi:MAG: hypothetical protein OXI33_11065 [Chloroflexota bacterium]|nr:hypothetical protein [Chloroflexota bacterium]
MYTHPALEYLLYYSDIVVHASLASVSIRTTSLPSPKSRFSEAEIPPGKTPAPACTATLDLRFDIDEYLMGTGPTEVLVEIPLMRTIYLKDGLMHFLHLKQETEADAVTWWSTRSPLWDTRKAVLFLKYDEDDEKTLFFTDRGFAPHSFVDRPESYERSWLPEVGDEFLPPPAVYGNYEPSFERNGNNTVPLTGDGSAPRFVSSSELSREGPTPVVISLTDLRSRIEAFEAVVEKGRGVPGYTDCIESVLIAEPHFRYSGKSYYPYQTTEKLPSGLPAGTIVQMWDRYDRKTDVIDYSDPWLDGPDKGLFAVTLDDDDDSASNGFYESLIAVRPLPIGKYDVVWYNEPYIESLCPDFMPNGFTLVRSSEWTISVQASVESTLHEAFFDPVDLASAVGVSEDGGVLQPADFTVNGETTTIRSLEWLAGTVSMHLEPYVSLDGFDIDVVDLNGEVRLTLSVADATVDRGSRTLTWKEPDQPWRWGHRLMLRIRPEGPKPPDPGPRPWIPEVFNLTAKAGTTERSGSSVPTVTLAWNRSDAVYPGGATYDEVQVWDGETSEWRKPSKVGIHSIGGGHFEYIYSGVEPGPYTFRIRYRKTKRSGDTFIPEGYTSDWKYVSVEVPGAVPDPNFTPTPVAPVPVGSP